MDKHEDSEWLEEKYVKEELTQSEMAKLAGVSPTTILRRLRRYDISRETPKYQDEEWLREKFCEEGWTRTEIANECGVTPSAITRWFKRYDIRTGKRFVSPTVGPDGYEKFRHSIDGDRKVVRHHRLLATLLVDDIEELKGQHVHHSYGVEWYNSLNNLEVLDPGEHTFEHHAELDRSERAELKEQYEQDDVELGDLAEEHGVSYGLVWKIIREDD